MERNRELVSTKIYNWFCVTVPIDLFAHLIMSPFMIMTALPLKAINQSY